MKLWIAVEARLSGPPEDWSLFADAFTRHGCTSSLVSEDACGLIGYLESVAGAELRVAVLADELRQLGAIEVRTVRIEDQDWSELWKKFFTARRIGESFVVVPSWESFEPEPGDRVLRLDPGQAFGTGEHPTTELCLELLEALAPRGRSLPAEGPVLDLGCGTGILAIAAVLCGAQKVTATDIEASAVEIARENAARNGVELELYEGDGLAEWAGSRRWSLVLSNIISATLIRLAPAVADAVEPGGHWIVSGVLNSNWPDVREATESAGFAEVEVRERDDWIGALFRRES